LLRSLAADGQAVSIKQLVTETGVSDKTIRRDVAELRQAGFPIIERVGDYGRKSFALEATALPLLTFTYDEALALYLCRSTATQFAGTFIAESVQKAFRKIRATLSRNTREYLERMLSRVARTGLGGNYTAKAELLDQILIGLEDSKAVFVTYRSDIQTYLCASKVVFQMLLKKLCAPLVQCRLVSLHGHPVGSGSQVFIKDRDSVSLYLIP
jgi:predicted DNA-binding transcriptional regulator YafY